MVEAINAAIVQVCTSDGRVCGAGFLVSQQHVLTCAHVVASALNLSGSVVKLPSGEVLLCFPLIRSQTTSNAQVVFWSPEEAEDIAVLEVRTPLPEEAGQVFLEAEDNLLNHHFRAFGFPLGFDDGVWATGKLLDRDKKGWLQLEAEKAVGFGVVQGFSGTPVWDEQEQGVVGMVVTATNDASIKAAFAIPSTRLREVIADIVPPSACPYLGLSSFREKDAHFFFGREDVTHKLLEAVRSRPLVAVIGPSGSGKSSVVFAGLIPCLRGEDHWQITSFKPGGRPFLSLAAALIPLLNPRMEPVEQQRAARKLAPELRQNADVLRDTLEDILAVVGPDTRLLLVADQFEELFTACQDAEERRDFLERLLTGVRAVLACCLTLTLRADFMEQALACRSFPEALEKFPPLLLGPMRRKELQSVIEEPARRIGMRVEEGLVESLLDDVGEEPGNLPLLEFALLLLWQRQKNGRLTLAGYWAIGKLKKALADYAEQTYGQLSEDEKKQAQQLFLQLVRVGTGSMNDTRRRVTKDEMAVESWELVSRLADARLVVSASDKVTDEETAEIAHEALIGQWPRLRQWLDENRGALLRKQEIEDAAHKWQEQGKRAELAFLLLGPELIAAEVFVKDYAPRIPLSELALEFIHASQDKRKKDLLRTRSLFSIGAVLIAGLLITGGSLWQSWQESQWEQLVSRVVEAKPTPELQNDLEEFLKGVKARTGAGKANLDLQHAYYSKALFAANRLNQVLTTEPEKQKRVHDDAEEQLGTLINKNKLGELTKRLETGSTKEALVETRRILLEETGADLDESKGLSSKNEERQIPCKTLKEIGEMWTEKPSLKPCGWGTYDAHGNFIYMAEECTALSGQTLTLAVFQDNYGSIPFLLDRLTTCGFVKKYSPLARLDLVDPRPSIEKVTQTSTNAKRSIH